MLPIPPLPVPRFRRSPRSIAILLALLFIASGPSANGADDPASDRRTSTLVVLAVGDPPVTRMISAGVDADGFALSQEAEVDPAHLPPPVLHLDKNSDNNNTAAKIPVFLNEFSPVRRFRARDGVRVHRDPTDVAELVRLPAGGKAGDHLLVLFPDPKTRNWQNTHSLVLPNDWSGFPVDSIRIINVCDFEGLIEVGGKKWRIRPRGTELIRPSTHDPILPYRLFVQTEQGVEILRRAALRIGESHRQTLVIHPTDPDFSRRMAAVAHFVESPRTDTIPK